LCFVNNNKAAAGKDQATKENKQNITCSPVLLGNIIQMNDITIIIIQIMMMQKIIEILFMINFLND